LFLAVRFAFERKKVEAKDLLHFAVFFVVTSLIPLAQYLPRRNRAPMLTREDFWRNLDNAGVFFAPFAVWWDALGVFFVVVVFVPIFVMDTKLSKLYLPSLVVFAFLNKYRLQPYSRQNVIGFYPLWMIPGSILFVASIKRLQAGLKTEEGKGLVIGIGAILYLLSIASGLLGVRNLHNQQLELWTPEMEKLAVWIAGNTPRKAVFVTSSQPFDPVVQLAGRVSYFQSARAAWSCGFVTEDRENEIREFVMSGGEAGLRKATYVFNWVNKSIARPLVRWGAGNWSKVYNADGFVIFQRST
jgi:hypothetical protein